MAEESSLVSLQQMERLWVQAQTPNPREGLFGPASMSWKVNREAALFLGAGRAALLQLAHPWVAAALDQHSTIRSAPVARFHNTFRVVFTMIFGTLEQALAASRHLHRLHTRIRGELPASVAGYAAGSHYEANEVGALIWVYATLVESALLAYNTVQPPLSAAERESYYAESRKMAALFGIPADALPANWAGFEAYNREMWSSQKLGINSLSREIAGRLLRGEGTSLPVPEWYRALTTAWLPERLRTEFELEYGSHEQEAVAKAERWLPRIYNRFPTTLRFVGPYREAQARLLGQQAGASIKLSNRFWMGVPQMMFSEAAQ